jgi:hypothetical protein
LLKSDFVVVACDIAADSLQFKFCFRHNIESNIVRGKKFHHMKV